MSAQGKLKELAERKAALRESIDRRRRQCAEAAAPLIVPLGWIDVIHYGWSRAAPWIKMGLPAARVLFARSRGVAGGTAGWLRWMPLGLQVVRMVIGRRSRQARQLEAEPSVH